MTINLDVQTGSGFDLLLLLLSTSGTDQKAGIITFDKDKFLVEGFFYVQTGSGFDLFINTDPDSTFFQITDPDPIKKAGSATLVVREVLKDSAHIGFLSRLIFNNPF